MVRLAGAVSVRPARRRVTRQTRPDDLRDWIRAYTPRLLAVARAFATADTGAEDLLQEVWWRAAERAHTRAAGVPLAAWLVTITVNLGRDHLRRTKRRAALWALWGGGARHVPPPEAFDHPASLLWREVAALPRLQREVLILRVVDDRSTAECAALLGRAEGTVKTSLARALARLRTRVRKEDEWGSMTTPATAK